MERYVEVIYNDNFRRLEYYNYNENRKPKRDFGGILSSDNKEESERTSLSRTKRNIREICLANNFEYFATITINRESANRVILSEVQDLLKKKLKAIKRKNEEFGYIFITEKHDKEGFHFHGLIKGVDVSNFKLFTKDDYDITKGNKLPYKLISSIERGDKIYHFDIFDSIGYNTISPIRDNTACCLYILKYITKDCVRNEHKQIYISSRGLKKAERVEVMPFNLDNFNVIRFDKKKQEFVNSIYRDNDYGVGYSDFDMSELSEEQYKCYTLEIIPKREFYKTHIDF